MNKESWKGKYMILFVMETLEDIKHDLVVQVLTFYLPISGTLLVQWGGGETPDYSGFPWESFFRQFGAVSR